MLNVLATILVFLAALLSQSAAHAQDVATDRGEGRRQAREVVCVAGCLSEPPKVVYRARRVISAGPAPKPVDESSTRKQVVSGIYCEEAGGCRGAVMGPYRRRLYRGQESFATVTVVGWWWYW